MIALEERDALKQVNRTNKWARKVDNMTDAQIIDAFLKLVSQGKI